MLTTLLYEELLFVVAPAFLHTTAPPIATVPWRRAGAVIPPKESLPDQFFVRTGPFSLTYTAVPGKVQRWGTCDYEASEPPFSSIWPVRSWLPFGKIHFNPTFFIPHRPFLSPHRQRSALSAVRRRPLRRTATRGARAVAAGGEQPRGQSFRDRSGAHGVTIITCRREAVHPQSISSLSFRCAPPFAGGTPAERGSRLANLMCR